jgi:hypothetical protein
MEHELQDTPIWFPADEWTEAMAKKASIEQQLADLGATPAYCLQYFQSGGGVCDRIIGGKCVNHRAVPPPLPAGKVCSSEFAKIATDLRRRVSEVETERRRLKREWDMLKAEQQAAAFQEDPVMRLVSWHKSQSYYYYALTACTTQESITERKATVRNDMTHCFKELRVLMGERLVLLESEPVDAIVWHDTVSSLLVEKIAVLEKLKLGITDRVEPPPAF